MKNQRMWSKKPKQKQSPVDESSKDKKKPDFDRYYYSQPVLIEDKDDVFRNPLYEQIDETLIDEAKKYPAFHVEIINQETKQPVPDPITLYMGNGQYVCLYRPKDPGNHRIRVTTNDEDVRNSPSIALVTDGIESVDVVGPGLLKAYQDKPAYFTVKPKDKQGRTMKVGGSVFKVDIKDPKGKKFNGFVLVEDSGDGEYRVAYTPKLAGNHEVTVKYLGKPVKGTPINVGVLPASHAPAAKECEILNFTPKGPTFKPTQFQVKLRDEDGSEITRGGDNVLVFVAGPIKIEPIAAHTNPIINYPEDLPLHHWNSKPSNERPHVFGVSAKPTKDVLPLNGLTHMEEKQTYPVQAIPHLLPFESIKPTVQDLHNGVYSVDFTPNEPGLYLTHVTVNDEPLPSSPYEMRIFDKFSENSRGSNYSFSIRTPVSTIKESDMTLKMITPDSDECSIPSIRKAADDKFHVFYDVPVADLKKGMYTLQVQYGDKEITGSPFQQTFGTKLIHS